MKEKNKDVKKTIAYGIIKVGSKGQVAIPKDLRDELEIEQGDQLIVVKRSEEKGFYVLKTEMLDELVLKFSEIDI